MANWKSKGFTPIPNVLINNPAIPRCVMNTYSAISERAFGKRYSTFASQETLAKDVGVTRMTVSRHLAVLEALGLIKRIRAGRGMTNTILLTLKMRIENTGSLTKAIQAEVVGLHALVLKREKLTMKEGLKLVSRKKRRQQEVSHVLRQARQIAKTYRGE